MDIDTLDLIGTELEGYAYSEEQKEFMDRIHTAIVNFDIDYLQNIEDL